MLSPSDLLHLPYTPDLTAAGIAYACRSLAYTYDRMGGTPADRLRRIVAGIAVELAFRRLLVAENVPHDVLGATPFTDPDRYDVAVGGRRCDLKSYLIYRKDRIRDLRTHPEKLLTAQALVPVDQFTAHTHDEDLYVFAFFTALLTPHTREALRARAADQPVYMLHALPERWARSLNWRALGRLVLKTESPNPLTLEIGGQNEERKFKEARLTLPPGERTPLPGEWYGVSYLAGAEIPPARVGIHSPALNETYIIQPHAWANIWVYGLDILLVGYITRGEFRRRARRLPAGSPVYQYNHTQTDNMFVPIGELHPLPDLFIRAQNWAS
ncbi:MAG: hypothetical protein Fur0022_44500 [Anaerolineales bacterium]